jgi:hypothetical protein
MWYSQYRPAIRILLPARTDSGVHRPQLLRQIADVKFHSPKRRQLTVFQISSSKPTLYVERAYTLRNSVCEGMDQPMVDPSTARLGASAH